MFCIKLYEFHVKNILLSFWIFNVKNLPLIDMNSGLSLQVLMARSVRQNARTGVWLQRGTRDKDENVKNGRSKHQLPNSGVDNIMNLITSKLCQCTKHIHPYTTACRMCGAIFRQHNSTQLCHLPRRRSAPDTGTSTLEEDLWRDC